jgi:predicted esterase
MGIRFALLALFCLPGVCQAQPERYELGARLKHFERLWNNVEDPTLREQSLTDLPKLTNQFFSFQFGEAGRTLTNASRILSKSKGTKLGEFLASLYAVPESRLIDAEAKSLTVKLKPFYDVKAEMPDLGVQFKWGPLAKGVYLEESIKKWPHQLNVPTNTKQEMPENWVADYRTTYTFKTTPEGKESCMSIVMVSMVKNLKARLEAIKNTTEVPAIELATLKDRHELLSSMADGFTPETDIPAGKLILEAEEIRKLGQKPYFTAERSGQYWLSIPGDKNRRTACRIFVPKNLKPTQPVPLVFALHGAGGSENLFFEGYGDGWVVHECEKRGWLLIATRSGLGFNSVPPLNKIIDQLGDRYPIDRKKVFLVGHSMGAAQSIAACQEFPGLFRGVAALGGTGSVRKKEAFEQLPVFVGVGDKDFALNGARSLSKALSTTGAKNVTYKEYPKIEHMVIVREALPDVFKAWDELVK